MSNHEDLVYRLKKRAEIRRQVATRKSVQEGQPDRIGDLLEEAASSLLALQEELTEQCRLNAMGQERELKLITELKAAQEESKRLMAEVRRIEKCAESWMNEYDKLKEKYEPMIVVTGEALNEGGVK